MRCDFTPVCSPPDRSVCLRCFRLARFFAFFDSCLGGLCDGQTALEVKESSNILSTSTLRRTRELRLMIFLLMTEASNGDSSSLLCTASSLGIAPRMGMLHSNELTCKSEGY